MPKTSLVDKATYAVLDLIDALQNPAPAAPFAQMGERKMAALKQLAGIFISELPTVEEPTLIYPEQPRELWE
eukprot:11009917-Ditylum_brightwellii.AAC.1